MSKKKVTTRTARGDFVSVKRCGVAINARFVRYADRAILCKMHVRARNGGILFSGIDEKFETKALCHPGDKEIPPDTFVEQTGMRVSYRRTKAFVKRIRRELKENIAYFEKRAAQMRELVEGLDKASDAMDGEFVKLLDTGLLVCNHVKHEATESVELDPATAGIDKNRF